MLLLVFTSFLFFSLSLSTLGVSSNISNLMDNCIHLLGRRLIHHRTVTLPLVAQLLCKSPLALLSRLALSRCIVSDVRVSRVNVHTRAVTKLHNVIIVHWDHFDVKCSLSLILRAKETQTAFVLAFALTEWTHECLWRRRREKEHAVRGE